jgi:hypothetical protein
MYVREDDTPYYVGKGSKKRAWESHKRRNNTDVKPVDHSRIKIVAHRLSEAEAVQLEIKLIKEYGRKDLDTGILRNLTNGGDGIAGAKLGTSVSKNTYLVIVKHLEEDTSKASDAKKLGVPLITVEDFNNKYF